MWVDINERLPEYSGQPYQLIVCNNFGGSQVVMCAVWNGGVFYNAEQYGGYVEDEDLLPDEIQHVSHWMLLPEAPTSAAVESPVNVPQQPQPKSVTPCKWGYALCVFDVCFERCNTCIQTKKP